MHAELDLHPPHSLYLIMILFCFPNNFNSAEILYFFSKFSHEICVVFNIKQFKVLLCLAATDQKYLHCLFQEDNSKYYIGSPNDFKFSLTVNLKILQSGIGTTVGCLLRYIRLQAYPSYITSVLYNELSMMNADNVLPVLKSEYRCCIETEVSES